MTDDSRHYWSATRLAQAIKTGEVSSVEVTEAALERIDAVDESLNAICVNLGEQALADARRADESQAAGAPLGALHGVPITIKEAIDIEGTASTWGLPERAGHVADSDATVVARLRDAGCVVLGKTNVPPSLADWQSGNEIYGRTVNPWDTARTPGGSSGGSAVSLAAGFGFLDVGSDIGGSLRNPVHFCGVASHKPTYDVVPATGHALDNNLRSGDLAVVGPMARTAADLAVALSTMAGPDGMDGRGYRLELPQPSIDSLSGVRIAVVSEESVCRVAAGIRSRIGEVADAAEAAGAIVTRDVDLPVDTAHSHDVYVRLLRASAALGLSPERFAAEQGVASSGDPVVWTTRVAQAYTQTHREWLAADLERSDLQRAWDEFFDGYDVVLCPVAPTVAWPHASMDLDDRLARRIAVDDTTIGYYEQLFWAGITIVSYLPSTVIPAGLVASSDGASLPTGVQLIGRHFGDLTTIRVGELLEREIGGFVPPPALDQAPVGAQAKNL